ncbi:MAG: ATP synthase F0 subunit B [Ilumatobacteraceae bacterium]
MPSAVEQLPLAQNLVIHVQGTTVVLPRETANTVKAGEESDPGPIIPEVKELIWGGGAFVLFALLMRFILFPKLKRGMDARYQGIRDDHANADVARESAKAEVAEYQSQLAGIRLEASHVIGKARETLEAERQARLAEVNVTLTAQRAVAADQADAARTAARGQIHAAVSSVAGRVGQLATGRAPAADVVDRAVDEVMAR